MQSEETVSLAPSTPDRQVRSKIAAGNRDSRAVAKEGCPARRRCGGGPRGKSRSVPFAQRILQVFRRFG